MKLYEFTYLKSIKILLNFIYNSVSTKLILVKLKYTITSNRIYPIALFCFIDILRLENGR